MLTDWQAKDVIRVWQTESVTNNGLGKELQDGDMGLTQRYSVR